MSEIDGLACPECLKDIHLIQSEKLGPIWTCYWCAWSSNGEVEKHPRDIRGDAVDQMAVVSSDVLETKKGER